MFPKSADRRRRIAQVLAWLALALAILMVARAMHKQGGVMLLNRAFGARFAAGLDPWFDPLRQQRVHGPYPPSLAWVAVPLASVPELAARGLWAGAQVGALAALFFLLRRRARLDFPSAAEHVPLLFALSLLLASRFLLRDFAGGGGNLLYGTLAFAGIEIALSHGALLAGIPLGISLALKPNLAPLLLFLALRGRWRALASAVVFTLIFFWLPALSYGPERYAALAREWASGVVQYAELEELHDSSLIPAGLPAAEDGMNQSLREAVQRLVRSPGDSGAVDVHVVDLSAASATWIARSLLLALIGLTAWIALRARDRRAEWLAMLAFFPLSLLISPITWKSHHALLVPLFFGLCCATFEKARARGWCVFLFVYWIACDLLSEEVAGRQAKRALQAAAVVTWFDIALIVALAILILRDKEPDWKADHP
ncbi:MAG TPA: glycosyltransferase family 87 protein [Planctomycetota bacterium]|nr:glycosyltransferase family 87 protein [Planctomycetota bacterium]